MAEPTYRHLRTAFEQGVLVLTVTEPQLRSGDFALIDALRQELLAAVTLAGSRKVIIDLSGVEYLGSAGFRPLLSLRKKLQEFGGEMLLSGLCDDVREVFLASRLINANGTNAAPFGVEGDIPRAVARLNTCPNGR
jgi:anti-anti-sigma factor